ncbi:MAG: NAD-dependent epimerase/dehydratase family protein [Gemmatimonadota bacterium]|nr:NAD-dependent epimerase/dehydratase family protein [Gemmatimonadota bacterium]
MSRALVTGAAGFIGRRVADLLTTEGHEILTFNAKQSAELLRDHVSKADFVFHLAGVNRPSDPADFERVNAKLTEELCRLVERASTNSLIVLASSTQALLENPYGVSKRHAEIAVELFAGRGGRAVIFRLPNVFGPGCRPDYNSVVATFAHNAASGIPLEVHDSSRELTLVYVHDVARAMADVMKKPHPPGALEYGEVLPVARITLQELADAMDGFRKSRANSTAPTVSGDLGRKLYATYLSYLAPDDFGYALSTRSDDRGSLAEFLKSPSVGQLFISRTRPGAVRGNHYHHTKTEKFFVVEGDGIIKFRRVDGTGEILEYPVSGSDFRVVDIPPDYTHSIENVGSGELVVLFWASEIFNPDAPDTFPLKV